MRVLISADMEGTAGVSSWVQVTAVEHAGADPVSAVEYERARARMTREVNAAVTGALAGGATEVVVNDSHSGMRNLIPEELHPACRFITGNDKPLSMMQGVDLPGMAAVLFTGYHAKAGTPNAPLAHTYSTTVNDLRINGVSTGEFGMNAIVAGHYGVPVVFVAGDDQAVAQTLAWVGPAAVGVVVKQGLSTFSALHEHPTTAQAKIEAGAREAMSRVAGASPWLLPAASEIEVEFDHQARAGHAAALPRVTLVGERTVHYTAADGLDFITVFRQIAKAGAIRLSL